MNGWQYLAAALEAWTAIGLIGLVISLIRREPRKLRQGLISLLLVWSIYLVTLLIVSARQPERHVALGQSVCFSGLCYTVTRVEELSGFPARNHTRLLRLTIKVTNGNKSTARENLAAFLRDGQRRIFVESSSISGNPLDARLPGGATVVAQPVFQLPPDAQGLALILTHGRWSAHTLVIGDAESLHHRLRLLDLAE